MPAREHFAGRIAGTLGVVGIAAFVSGAALAPVYRSPPAARSLWRLVHPDLRLEYFSPLLLLLLLSLAAGLWLFASSTNPRLPSGILLGCAGGGLAYLSRLAVTATYGGRELALGWGAATLFAGILCILAAGVFAASLVADRRAVVGPSVAAAAILALPFVQDLIGTDLGTVIVGGFGALAAGAIVLMAAALWRAIASRTLASWGALLGGAGFAAASFLPAAEYGHVPLLDLDAPASVMLVGGALPIIVAGLAAIGAIVVADREQSRLGAGLLVGAALPATGFLWLVTTRSGLSVLAGFWVGVAATVLLVLAVVLALRDGAGAPGAAAGPDAAPA